MKVVKNGAPARGLKATWSIGPDNLPALRNGEVEIGVDGARIEAGTRSDPGFLRLVVSVQDEGRPYRGLSTVGFALDAAVYGSISRGAIDYLASLENWDGKSIGGIGSSQGGALSIVTAALAASHPALSDATGSLYGRAGGWPDIFKDPS